MLRAPHLGLYGLLLGLVVAGCECGDEPGTGRPFADASIGQSEDAGPGDDGGAKADGGPRADAGADLDAGARGDAGADLDAGARPDAGSRLDAGDGADAGDLADAGQASDAGAADDAGFVDAGDGADAGFPDAGFPDASFPDVGFPDSGIPPDAGFPDSGVPPDAGFPDSGVVPGSGDLWVEIRYAGANSATSPRWFFSNSPGWTRSSWDFRGSRTSGPEVWDIRQSARIVNDHVGRAAVFGTELQLMFGLIPLISSTGVTVDIEGRSYNCCAPVRFDVYNPLTGCGVSGASMSQSWTPSAVSLDLTGCFLPGVDPQAVRIDPSSGNVALTRMRVTFHGAAW